MAETKFRFFEFGEFRLDAHRRILQKNGEPIHLTPRAFDLLCVMVENAGRVLEHDELLEKVWSGTFVEQGNLKKTISALRSALGESPAASEFITTVPRRGYRFSAPVRSFTDEAIFIRETKAEIIVEEEIEDERRAFLKDAMSGFPFRQAAFASLAVLALAAAVFAVWFFGRKNPQRFSAENVRQTRFLAAGDIGSGSLSKDGNFYAYTIFEKTKASLWVKDTSTGGTNQIVPPVNASFWWITMTPDGKYVCFYFSNRDEPARSGVYRVPTIGGVMELISEKNYSGMKFSPDGKRLAVYRTFLEEGEERQEILTINADGGDELQIIKLPLHSLVLGLAWSPDGSNLLYGVKKQTASDKPMAYAAEIPANGGAEKVVMPEQEKIFYVQDWMPDKNSFLICQREVNSEIFQIWQYFPASGEMSRVTNDDSSYTGATVTTDGKTIGAFRSFGISSIWLGEDFDNLRQIADGGSYYSIEWTADDRLVFSTTENGREFVGIMNADGSQKRLLTGGADGIRQFPSVARDGKHIIFMSERSGSRQVWQMDLDGRNLRQLTDNERVGEAKLLADGQTLIYLAYVRSKTWGLIKQTANGKSAAIFDADTYEWDISYDEKRLAIYAPDANLKKNLLLIRDFESGATLKTFEVTIAACLRWTRDGQGLVYIRYGEGMKEIVLQPLDGSAERVLTTVRGETIRNFDFSPDGKRLALVRSKAQNEAVLIRIDNLQ